MSWDLATRSMIDTWVADCMAQARRAMEADGFVSPIAIVWARRLNGMDLPKPLAVPVAPQMYNGAWTPLYREAWAKTLKDITRSLKSPAISIVQESRYRLVDPVSREKCEAVECVTLTIEHEDSGFGSMLWVAPTLETPTGKTLGAHMTLTEAVKKQFKDYPHVNPIGAFGRFVRLLPCHAPDCN